MKQPVFRKFKSTGVTAAFLTLAMGGAVYLNWSYARALPAEELQKEARFYTDAEAVGSVPAALRKAVDYAEEQNLAGVVVCGSLYLAAEARPWLLKEAEK